MTPVFVGPPKPRHDRPETWPYRCAALGCGEPITGWERDPMEGPPLGGLWRTKVPGPSVRHLPCGHEWWIDTGGWLR